jgi:hypothetical protein
VPDSKGKKINTEVKTAQFTTLSIFCEKIQPRVDKVAFNVKLRTDTSGKESLRWRGM